MLASTRRGGEADGPLMLGRHAVVGPLLLVVVLLRRPSGASALGSDSLTRLYNFLLRDYEREVRPALRHDHPIDVQFAFALTQIIDVDERNQILTINSWLRQNWIDYKLTWYPPDFDNLTRIHIPYEKIWRPDVVLYNNADSQYTKSVMSTDVVVDFEGNVTWASAGIFKSSCPLDVRLYPFDFQECVLKFASWAYDGTKIDLLLNMHKATKRLQIHANRCDGEWWREKEKIAGDERNYMMSTEWELLNIRAEKNTVVYSCCPEPYPFIDVHIIIQRRPMFYIFHMILPSFLISGIALLGFYMPPDSGEKVTLGITSLLSTTVFLMLVAEGMPPTAEALPLIGIYYGVTIFIVSLATAMTVFTLNVHHYGVHGQAVPAILQKIAFEFLAKILFVKVQTYHSITHHVNYFYQKEHAPEEASRNSVTSDFTFSECSPFLARRFVNGGDATEKTTPVAKKVTQKKKVSFPGLDFTSTTLAATALAPMTRAPSRNDPVADRFEEDFLRVLNRLHATIERNEMRLAEKDRRDATTLEWQQVAMVLDRFLLIVFLVGTTLTSFVILYQRQLDLF